MNSNAEIQQQVTREMADQVDMILEEGAADFDPIREFISAVWSDCRLPGNMRRDLEALYHNGVMPALDKS